MLISHSEEFLFVHIYKTGGTSIREALRRYRPWELRGRRRRAFFSRLGRLTGYRRWLHVPRHPTAREIRSLLPGSTFDDYFSFSFTRNPWNWNVSLYFYQRTAETHRNHAFVRNLSGFEEFIELRTDARRDVVRRFYDYVIERPDHDRHEFIASFQNFQAFWEHRRREGRQLQKDFVADEAGRVIVDFVGKMERFEKDFDEVCRRIQIPTPELPRRNVTDHRHYREYYSDRSRSLVADHFAEDVRTFDYDF